MTRYHVEFTPEAKKDLFELYSYVALNDSHAHAKKLVGRLEALCQDLQKFPVRGRIPPELDRIGVMLYRELSHGSYRIIYQITEKTVIIHCILDGRRDMQELLKRRLIRP